MLTKRQIIRAFDQGQLTEVAKECVMYGLITRDVSWDTPEGYYKGSHRVRDITHYGIEWTIDMWNGEVHSVGHNHVPTPRKPRRARCDETAHYRAS